MRIKRVVAPGLLVLLFGSLLIQLPIAIAARASDYDFFDSLVEMRHLLASRYVEEPDQEAMQEAMIEGMIDSLDDPHTMYVAPRQIDDFNKGLHGTYVGIGAEVNETEDGYLEIVSPMEGSPALEAGVLAGDRVLEIDGQPTLDLELFECIDLLLGEPGTTVTIRVRHLDGTEENLTLTRRQIVTRTVRGLHRDGEQWMWCIDEDRDLSYVRIAQFNEQTSQELLEALEQLVSGDGLGGLVLDLRDNPGGELMRAVEIADLFLDEGVIVSVRDRNGDGQVFQARAEGTLPDFPMIVLVNGGSASASEIVSGALQESGRAKVLGTRTHGKGSVQEVRNLSLGRGVLKLTTAYYYLASGRNLHRRAESTVWGVDPDAGYLVPVTDDQYVERMRRRHEHEVIKDHDVARECADAQWIREHLADEQLGRAVERLQARIDEGQWPQIDEEGDAAQIALEAEIRRLLEARTRESARLGQLDQEIARLRSLAEQAGNEPLLPEDVDLLAGRIIIEDRNGRVIGAYRIDGGDVEMALETLDVSPIREGQAEAPPEPR